jgi:hypothetical protein
MTKKRKSVKRRAVPKAVQAKIRRMSATQLYALLVFLQALMRARHTRKVWKTKGRKKGGTKTARQRRFAALARKYHGRIPKGTRM